MAQSVKAFASHAEGWMFESQLQQACVVKASSDSSTGKRSATDMGVAVLGYDHFKRMSCVTVGLARQRTLTT